MTTKKPETAKSKKLEIGRYNLHVALIMETEQCTKAKAQFYAYKEGVDGFRQRMGELPLTVAKD